MQHVDSPVDALLSHPGRAFYQTVHPCFATLRRDGGALRKMNFGLLEVQRTLTAPGQNHPDSEVRARSKRRTTIGLTDIASPAIAAARAGGARAVAEFSRGGVLVSRRSGREAISGPWCGAGTCDHTTVPFLRLCSRMCAIRAVRAGGPSHPESWWLPIVDATGAE